MVNHQIIMDKVASFMSPFALTILSRKYLDVLDVASVTPSEKEVNSALNFFVRVGALGIVFVFTAGLKENNHISSMSACIYGYLIGSITYDMLKRVTLRIN